MRGERPVIAGVFCATCAYAAGAGAQDPPLQVTVRGSTAGGYASRTSTETSPREPIDAASMLDELPSVHIRRLGAEGSFASISVRGSAPSQVGVVLGQIPLTSGADPAFDVGSLPLWPGASFRVYRSFAPASLGTTGHLGGVLAVDPPSPATGGRTEWGVLGGSLGSLKLRIGDLRRTGGLESGTGFFASRTDGDFPYLLETPLGSGKLTQRIRTNAGQVAVGGIERLSVERPWGSVAGLVFADARSSGVPGAAETPTRFVRLGTTRLVTGLEASVRTGAAGAVRFLGWARRETSALDDPQGELGATHATTTRSAIEAAGLAAGWRGRPVDELTLGLVLDGRGERFVPESAIRFQGSEPASRLAAGAGADLEWRPTSALTVSGSGRIDLRRDDAGGVTAPIDHAPLGVSGGVAPTGHLGGSYRFSGAAIVSAHGGALSRPPGFLELYGNGASLIANPTLRPERALAADAGVHGDVGDGRVSFGYELVGFVTSATDLITFAPIGLGTFQAINVDHAILGGAELTASLSTRRLRTQVTYTFLRTENLGDGPQHGEPLPGRPAHDLAYDASCRLGPARLRYGLDLVAGTTVDTAGNIVLPARVLHGAGASMDVPGIPGLRAGIEVQNLFDQRIGFVFSPGLQRTVAVPVSDFLGFPLPGRTVWASIRFTRPAP